MEEVRFVEALSCRECIASFQKCRVQGVRAALIADRESRSPCRGCVLLKDQRKLLERGK